MRSLSIGFAPVAAMLVLGTAQAEDEQVFPGGNTATFLFSDACEPEFQGGDADAAVPEWLRRDELGYVRADEGQAVPLNTIIVMPSLSRDDEALLIVEFSRSELNEAFVEAYFFDRQALIPVVHPYARLGVEYILTDERLILKIHPGVILHLRDDSTGTSFNLTDNEPEYRRRMFTNPAVRDVFRRDDVVGRVIHVSGDVHVSDNPQRVRSDFGYFHAWVGRTIPGEYTQLDCLRTTPSESTAPVRMFPDSYPPRVVSGR